MTRPGPAAPLPSLPISFAPSLSLPFSVDPLLPGLPAMSLFPAHPDEGLVSSRLRVPSRGFSLPNPGTGESWIPSRFHPELPLELGSEGGGSLCHFLAGQGECPSRLLCVWELAACLLGPGIDFTGGGDVSTGMWDG